MVEGVEGKVKNEFNRIDIYIKIIENIFCFVFIIIKLVEEVINFGSDSEVVLMC